LTSDRLTSLCEPRKCTGPAVSEKLEFSHCSNPASPGNFVCSHPAIQFFIIICPRALFVYILATEETQSCVVLPVSPDQISFTKRTSLLLPSVPACQSSTVNVHEPVSSSPRRPINTVGYSYPSTFVIYSLTSPDGSPGLGALPTINKASNIRQTQKPCAYLGTLNCCVNAAVVVHHSIFTTFAEL
jgi:hypothetical protein